MSFNTYYERKNTRSLKWDMLNNIFKTEDVLPMWVADMDFKAPKEVNEAIIERAKHGIYGYTIIDDPVKDSIVNWIDRRHNWKIHKDWLSFSPGVVTSLQIAIEALTNKNDKILIQTPVYTPFYNVIRNTKREIIKNPLIFKNNRYEIDFDLLENQLKDGVKAFILCSPHNPVGRVWTKEELRKMAELCLKYNVLILSDEIHCDIIYPGNKHIPISLLSEEIAENTVTFMSASKTFNLAGLQSSYIVTPQSKLRTKLNRELDLQGLSTLNTMGITALEAAYTYGEKWLNELITTLTNHKNYTFQMFSEHLPELTIIEPEGTYLLWIDCSKLEMDHQSIQNFMIKEAKVGLSPGIQYGEEGALFMRMNIACPQVTLEKGIHQIIKAVR